MKLEKKDVYKLIGKSDPIIFDVGCYDGKDTREILDLIPAAKIYCFEADSRSQSLFERFQRETSMTLIKSAVGSIDGNITLYQSDSSTRRHYPFQESWSASSSIRKPKNHLNIFPDVSFKDQVTVQCTKLDTWCKNTGLENAEIDFMWVDVNGAEMDFVAGALQTLKRTRYFYIEFSDKELYEGECKKEELLNALNDHELLGIYGYYGNFGNLLLRNKNEK